jgi:hypothetical protein
VFVRHGFWFKVFDRLGSDVDVWSGGDVGTLDGRVRSKGGWSTSAFWGPQ